MKIAFIVYNGFTALDFIGAYDSITRLKYMNIKNDLEWDVCALTEHVGDEKGGLQIIPTSIGKPLDQYDMIYVAGGFRTNELVDNQIFMNWFKTCKNVKLKTSVCTGSILLGAAGFLENKRATTHRNAQERLKKYCSEVVDERIVDDGDIITARGVTSSIDIGLYIVEKIAGKEAKEKIRIQMDYQE